MCDTIYSVLLQQRQIDGGKEMKCPFCSYYDSKVIDSRPASEGTSIRRRRECLECNKRFTTYEIVERTPLVIIKRDGTRQAFDKSKIIKGMLTACEKRPISMAQLEIIADDVEQELRGRVESEVKSDKVGELIMSRLRDLDEVAYVRFASVYRSFSDLETFMDELNKMVQSKG